ncbi:hypothetical protein [Paenibacillus ginsengarvi]|uniref:Uncharacterized protein n=1 Tax=Paenibacillus ginsengarvi TaxID=400777 RepID=A0A3B0BNT0_9BACL|nr:hypothetical protein [Paenibacillus ginsengarvi]RKN75025.1 hypothetical protein D7M11_26175 [Paenibacillus ginsengarvi]
MIKLTLLKTGKPHWLIVEHVTGVGFGAFDDMEGTAISRVNDEYSYPPLYVKETPEEVVRMVMDYKLSIRYKASCHPAFTHRAETENPFTPPLDEWLIMKRLAGLEQTP